MRVVRRRNPWPAARRGGQSYPAGQPSGTQAGPGGAGSRGGLGGHGSWALGHTFPVFGSILGEGGCLRRRWITWLT